MSKVNFDEYIERRGTDSDKWDNYAARFTEQDARGCVPMWVADMDFLCPPEVKEAVCRRAELGIYGYNIWQTKGYNEATVYWAKQRYHWDIDEQWIVFTPGIVPAICNAVVALTKPGDGVIVQMPVYYPFHKAIEMNGRVLRNNQLIERDGYYTMDFDGLEALAREPGNTMMILCSPHNPVGRVWKREELERVCEICKRNGVILVSDEIHADLLMPGTEYVSTGSIAKCYEDNIISCFAPSKTFNMAGLQASAIVIPNPALREAFRGNIAKTRLPSMNVFAGVALEAAWKHCEYYAIEVMEYIAANIDHTIEFFRENTPKIKMRRPEGTYLGWVDISGLGLSVAEGERFIIERAKIAADLGAWFGPGGEKYVRFNFACHRSTLDKALAQLKAAYDREFA